MYWLKISFLLSLVGFLKEFRPSEPFYVDYMQEPHRDVTTEELNRFVLSTIVYADGVLSIIVLLVTDLLRYKVIIVLIGFSGVLTWGTLLWTRSFASTQLLLVFYALHETTEVAYFAYIFAKVSKEHYLAVSSHARAALMAGKFASGMLGQLLLSSNLMNLRELHYVTFGSEIAATLVSLLLPKVKGSIYFSPDETKVETKTEKIENSQPNAIQSKPSRKYIPNLMSKFRHAFKLMWQQFKFAYSNKTVILWSLWYSSATCGYMQITIYVQLLWNEIDKRKETDWNGAVEAVTTLLCAAVALLASRLHDNVINTKAKVLWSLFVMSLCTCASILVMSNCGSRMISYGGYVAFYILFTYIITIASAEIAKQLPEDSYGLVFGINTFVAYWMQIILTLTVATDIFNWKLSIVNQFNVYGSFFGVLGIFYFALILKDMIPVRSTLKINAVSDNKF